MKYKKFLGYGAIGLTLIAVGVAFIKPISSSNLLLRARAINVTGGTIVFDKSNTTKSGTTNTTPGTTNTGGVVVCKTFYNDSTQSSGYVGAVKTGSIIKFFESDGSTEYTFENLHHVSFAHTGTSFGFNLTGIYDDGTPFNLTYSARTTNPRGINFDGYGKVAHLRVEVTSDIVTKLNSITFTYDCTSKSLTGVEVANAPTKTSYIAGESFDPSGMLIKAVYSNETKVATEAYDYSPKGVLSTSDTEITISYGGFVTTQSITVESAGEGLNGVYTYNASFNFTTSTAGEYSYSGNTLYFTYIVSGSSIIFTYISGNNDEFGNYKLFNGSDTTNTTGSVLSLTQIKVTTYGPFGATNRTFTKSS